MKIHALAIEGRKTGDWLWCYHCERVYQAGEYREVSQYGEALQMCPYPGCDGDTVLDAREWDDWFKTHYSEIPERGVVYPEF